VDISGGADDDGPVNSGGWVARLVKPARTQVLWAVRRQVDDLESLLWRAVALFRIVSCGYAAMLTYHYASTYTHPAAGFAVIGIMAVWSLASVVAYAHRAGRCAPVLVADLAVTFGCLLATRWVVPPGGNPQILPMLWVAAPALAWGVVGGSRAGAGAGLALSVGNIFVRGDVNEGTVNLAVLVLLPGAVMGYVAELATQVEARSRRAAQLEAATAERERLAGAVHDSVLQVLALVQRRGAEIGGPAAELGRLAGEQEVALRALVAADVATRHPDGVADVCAALRGFAASKVTLALPAQPIPLPAADCAEIAAAVRAALDNVARHTGPDTAVWILAERTGTGVTVTVRDNGPGIAAGRLAQAEAEGRLGIAQSIRARINRIGGSVTVTAPTGQGTEIELQVPVRVLAEAAV
jgi:signal transduction histidine kinase